MESIYLIIKVLFWLCVYLILHSYIIYPLILKILAAKKKQNDIVFAQDESLPKVSIVIAAYNEQEVIEEKIRSIFATSYPAHLFDVHIGSDNSNDATNNIIESYAAKYPNLFLHAFTSRQGKANIINTLVAEHAHEIVILTDANVYFGPETIYELVKHYKNPEIGLVGGYIINTNVKNTGISYQEKTYLSHENMMKYQEGIIWGTMVGAFGGVYSIRKELYHPVPKNYFMDDFYITMQVIANGKKAITELQAVCYEDVSNVIQEEFRRKVRISIGNFQNLSSFAYLARNPFSGKGFSFISHKILRWITPFLLIDCFVFNAILYTQDILYSYLFFCQIGLLLLPILDMILKSVNIHNAGLRFITHFYSMNAALLLGFFRYIKGIDTNVWQPTKRNQ